MSESPGQSAKATGRGSVNIGGNAFGPVVFGHVVEAVSAAGGVAAVASLAREALRQRGETARTWIRQTHETIRALERNGEDSAGPEERKILAMLRDAVDGEQEALDKIDGLQRQLDEVHAEHRRRTTHPARRKRSASGAKDPGAVEAAD